MQLRLVVALTAPLDERERLVNDAKALIESSQPAQRIGDKSEVAVADIFRAGHLQLRHMVSHAHDAALGIVSHRISPPEINLAQRSAGEEARFSCQCPSRFRPRSYLPRLAAKLVNVGGKSVYVREDILRSPGFLRDCGRDIHSLQRAIGV